MQDAGSVESTQVWVWVKVRDEEVWTESYVDGGRTVVRVKIGFDPVYLNDREDGFPGTGVGVHSFSDTSSRGFYFRK